MQYSFTVDVFETDAHLQEYLPDPLLLERASQLLLEKESEVSSLAVLHYDIEEVVLKERVQVPHYEGAFEPRQNCCLVNSLSCSRCTFRLAFSFMFVRLTCLRTYTLRSDFLTTRYITP